jgi:DNA-binding transcriptional LysR family regulator
MHAPERLQDLLPCIASFVVVVEAKGFAAAARRLNTTRSAISKQVARLETAWGVKLLRRTTRAVSLTEPGLRAYEHALQIPALAAKAEESAADLARSPRGVLRVTASVSFGQHVLVPLLPRFRQLHPQVEVELHLTDRIVELVEEGFDVAIRLSARLPDGVVARKLGGIRYGVWASPGLAGLDQMHEPDDLTRLPCLRFSGRGAREAWVLTRGAKRVAIQPQGPLAANTSDALQALASAGEGLALLPEYACRSAVERGELVPVLTGWQAHGPFGDTCWAIRSPERRVLPKVSAFIAYLDEAFQRAGSDSKASK